jgi:hypothetical protein
MILATTLAGYIVTYAILLGCGVICGLKGKYRFLAVGFVFPIFWIVGAVKAAKPGSAWTSYSAPEDFSTSEALMHNLAEAPSSPEEP